MERVFVYDGREFPDPDPAASVEDVKKMMQDFFPELANAEVREHAKGEDKVVHEFIRRVGTKGDDISKGLRISITPVNRMLLDVSPQDLPEDAASFWACVAQELDRMLFFASQSREPQIVLKPARKAGEQYIWEFYVNDLTVPRADRVNWHGQNVSQWMYAGCILLQNGRVSTHH